MEKVIYKYFDRQIYIIGKDIYVRENILNKSLILSSWEKFIAEMRKVFSLKDEEIKTYLKKWLKKDNKLFDFNLFWGKTIIIKNFGGSLF